MWVFRVHRFNSFDRPFQPISNRYENILDATVLSDGNKCLEPGPQGSMGLLSHRHHPQILILEGRAQGRFPMGWKKRSPGT